MLGRVEGCIIIALIAQDRAMTCKLFFCRKMLFIWIVAFRVDKKKAMHVMIIVFFVNNLKMEIYEIFIEEKVYDMSSCQLLWCLYLLILNTKQNCS